MVKELEKEFDRLENLLIDKLNDFSQSNISKILDFKKYLGIDDVDFIESEIEIKKLFSGARKLRNDIIDFEDITTDILLAGDTLLDDFCDYEDEEKEEEIDKYKQSVAIDIRTLFNLDFSKLIELDKVLGIGDKEEYINMFTKNFNEEQLFELGDRLNNLSKTYLDGYDFSATVSLGYILELIAYLYGGEYHLPSYEIKRFR